jgi:nucleotide-binding universal stress UspA family protein
MKILLAVDGSMYSDAALEEVAARPWPSGSELLIISVYSAYPTVGTEMWAIPAEYVDEILEAGRAAAEAAVAKARGRVKGNEALSISAEVLVGSPARSILDKAEEWSADLIILGSHGNGAFKRILLGSVSHAIVLHATCSVEIVRRPCGH